MSASVFVATNRIEARDAVLRELQRRATVRDGKVRRPHGFTSQQRPKSGRTVFDAGLELGLERTVGHLLNEEVAARSAPH